MSECQQVKWQVRGVNEPDTRQCEGSVGHKAVWDTGQCGKSAWHWMDIQLGSLESTTPSTLVNGASSTTAADTIVERPK